MILALSFIGGLILLHVLFIFVIVPIQYKIADKMGWEYDVHTNSFKIDKIKKRYEAELNQYKIDLLHEIKQVDALKKQD